MAKDEDSVDVNARMRAKGFIPAKEVSKRVGKDISAVYRWLDAGEVVGMDVVGRRYVNLASLVVSKVGIEASVVLGLITEQQAKELAKNSKK